MPALAEPSAALPHWLSNPCSYGVHVSRGRYLRAAHVELIAEAFQRCALQPGGRLMIITPPRHSKSSTASQYGAAWYLTHYPERRVLFASYGADFAGGWGQAVRNLIDEYGGQFGVTVTGRRRVQNWTTNHGGGMRSIGAGATAGMGAHLLIMDDTVSGSEAALSPTIQEKLWNWYLADFTTRRERFTEPGGETSLVAIGTRWTENDLLGRLLKAYEQGPGTEGYEPWEVLYLPALYDGLDWTGRRAYEDPLGREIGEALWPDSPFTRERLLEEQKAKPWWFAALYQGRPEPLEGGILKQHSWSYWTPAGYVGADKRPLEPVVVNGDERPLRDLPQMLRVMISVDCNFVADLADLAKGRDPSDVAVHVVGLGPQDERLFWLDRATEIMDLNGTVECVAAMRDRYLPGTALSQALGLSVPPLVALVEAKANGPAVMAQLRRRGIVCVPVTPLVGKIARVVERGDTEAHRYGRATAMADDLLAGKLHLPHPSLVLEGRTYRWSLDLRHKFAQFPRQGKDDTDAASQAHAKLTVIGYAAGEAEARDAARTEAHMKHVAGLPQSAKMPTNLFELRAARDRVRRAKEDKRVERMIEKVNGRGRHRGIAAPWGGR